MNVFWFVKKTFFPVYVQYFYCACIQRLTKRKKYERPKNLNLVTKKLDRLIVLSHLSAKWVSFLKYLYQIFNILRLWIRKVDPKKDKNDSDIGMAYIKQRKYQNSDRSMQVWNCTCSAYIKPVFQLPWITSEHGTKLHQFQALLPMPSYCALGSKISYF